MTVPKPPVPALVVVDWLDSSIGHHKEQMEQQDAGRFMLSRCMTVGFLLLDADDRVVLGFIRFDLPEDADYTPDYGHVLAIPKVAILSMRMLATELPIQQTSRLRKRKGGSVVHEGAP